MSRKRRKLSQAQKDLKKALKINYRRATTSTSQSNVTCKSCGKPGHSRRSSKLCDEYRPRTKALAKEAWECKPELFTIKDSLSKSCRSEIAISNIQKIIPIVRDITFDAANLANRHFLRLLTTGQSISEEYFDKSNWFFIACLKMVSGEIPYVPEYCKPQCHLLNNTFNEYPVKVRHNAQGLWHLIQPSATLYHTNIINHLADHFDDRLGRYIFFHLWELRHNIQIDDQQVDHESVQYEEVEEDDDKASKKDPVKWEKLENGHVWKLTNYIKRKACSQEPLFPLFVKTMALQDRRKTIQLVNEILKEIQKEMPNNPQLLSLELLVYSKPHEFYNFFFKILVFFEGRRYSREPTPKQAATKGYVHRKIMKIFGTDNISTNFKNKLNSKIRERINVKKGKPWDQRTVSLLSQTQLAAINSLIHKVQSKIRSKAFRPKTFADPKGCRRFTLLPILSLKQLNVHIDYQSLCQITKKKYNHSATNIEKTNVFQEIFKFERIGTSDHQNDFDKKRRMFQNSMETDGISVSFLFARPPKAKCKEVKWSSINLDLEKDRVWAVDPGITDVFVASDGHQGNHEIRRTSTKEYQHMCGFNLENQRILKWKKKHRLIIDIEQNMPSAKTSDLAAFDDYIKYTSIHHSTITNFLDVRFNKSKFKRYLKKQQAISEICRRLGNGSGNYGTSLPSTNERKHKVWPQVHWQKPNSNKASKWRPNLPADELEKRTVIAFGDGDFGTTRRGKKAAAYKVIYRSLCRLQRTVANLKVLFVPEPYSSQVCSKCNTRTLDHMHAHGLSLHAVLKCKTCRTVWNRDCNASRNLFHIATYAAMNDNNVPAIFERKKK